MGTGKVVVVLIIVIILAISGYFIYVRFFKKGTKKVGDKCSSNRDCVNNACGRATAADNAILVCCASGATTPYDGFDYCNQMPNGSVCWSDVMCASGHCRGNLGGLQKGTCGN